MQYNPLGNSGLEVSRVCLGSMTWGTQNCQRDADQQIEYALSHGVNFIDTAEMYSVPPSAETYGATETIIGDWLSRHPEKRGDIVLATKIAGAGLDWIRDGAPITGEAVVEAVDGSLKRLQTDYIDLYQLHWPNRSTPHFAKHGVNDVRFTEANTQQHQDNMLDILQGLAHCVKAGKVRHCGLSDDTTWGINTYLRLAREHQLPAMVSIQNEFSLLHSKDWPYLIENCVHENLAFLPWSPLGGGMLSGKYIDGQRPQGTRWTISQRMGLFRDTAQSNAAVKAYVKVAKRFDITPSQLALAWCHQVDGVTSTIIGATSMAQLQENMQAFELDFSDEMSDAVNAVLREYPSPF